MAKPIVLAGVAQGLDETAICGDGTPGAFLNRFLLMNKSTFEGSPLHIAVHLIEDLTDPPGPYVATHSHATCDEIGLVIGSPGALEYEVVLGSEVCRVSSPASIFIPAGTAHRATALRGTGAFVCIQMDPRGPADPDVSQSE